MKYYIGNINELNGEYEYDNFIKFYTDKSPHNFLDFVASSWYSDCEKTEEEGVYISGDGILVFAGGYQEIDLFTFNKLEIITDMTERVDGQFDEELA